MDRCRTCRKRKTRCDGKRPLCSTCTENGHECLGYADIAEGTKKERKDSDVGAKKEHEDDDGEDEDDKHPDGAGQLVDTGTRHIQRPYSNGSREIRRAESKGRSYFDTKSTIPKGREASEREKDQRQSFRDYRESAVFSEDGHSPLGNSSNLESIRIRSTDEALIDRSPPLQTDSHRVPYFRYFGPTAIVPGFKQMVVSVREHRRSTGPGSCVSGMFYKFAHFW
jgi:hypothetical protein